MTIYKKFTFDAAHFLPNAPVGHKCRALHGHTYTIIFFVSGPVLEDAGWVIDFTEIKAACKPLIDRLDHALLNDIQGLENPTAENVAVWLWKQLKDKIPGLEKIELRETPTSGVVYNGD